MNLVSLIPRDPHVRELVCTGCGAVVGVFRLVFRSAAGAVAWSGEACGAADGPTAASAVSLD
jgi:hypothetical protein